MSDIKYRVVTADKESSLRDENYKMARIAWPEFMLHDQTSELFYDLFNNPKLTKYQFGLFSEEDNRILSLANSIPLRYDGDLNDLPDRGWDWALTKGVDDANDGVEPNFLCAIQVMIPPEYKGKHISTIAVNEMKNIGRQNGLKGLIAPVRPNLKTLYPLTPMDNYIRWENGDGLPFDAWMRVHARLGAKIIKVCPEAMTIPGTISEWEKWSGLKFPESGKYAIPGALIPIDIDIENDKGLYIEPNVWMHHPF